MSRRLVVVFSILLACPAAIHAADKPAASAVEVVIDGGKAMPKLNTPFGIAFDRDRRMYLVELDGGRLFSFTGKDGLRLLGGNGSEGFAGDGGPVGSAVFNGMHNVAALPDGTLFIADTWNNRVRRVDDKSGIITTLAGTGEKAFGGDGGPAIKAAFAGTFCVTLDPAGKKLLVTDLGNRRIRAIDLESGNIETVAGNGKAGKPSDGSVAKESPLVDPRAAAADSHGNLYVLERGGHALRVVSADGRIRTIAGGSGKAGRADGAVEVSTLNGPKHLCVDPSDRVLIADAENNLIRLYDPKTGLLTTLPIPDLARPHGVTIGPDSKLYIVDSYHHRVLRTDLPH